MLKDEIETAKRSVNTDTVQITIGEMANMYGQKELDILPDFQRLFRWSDERKSNFVESILIGIPIPPVFVYETADGTWELIDGLQRISTVLEFMGVLRDVDTGDTRSCKLLRTKYLPSLEGVVWQVKEEGDNALDKAFQLFFRRARIDFQILKHPSDQKTKFDLFQRLNRGGAYANEQEVRTCSMVLANGEFTQKIRQLAQTELVEKIFSLTPDQKNAQRNIEYIVRVIVHTYIDYDNKLDVQEFLDSSIVDILTTKAPEEVLGTVQWAIEILFRLFGDRALFPTEDALEGVASRFSLRALEAIVVGLTRNHLQILALPDPDDFVRNKVRDFWTQPDIASMSASGLRGTVRIQRTVPYGELWFKPND